MLRKNNSIKTLIYIYLNVFILFSLTSCSSLNFFNNSPTPIPENKRTEVWLNNQKDLQNFKQQRDWTLLARVGLVSEQGSSSSQLDWVNQNNHYKITLNNMLTYGVITIANNNNLVSLNYQDKTYTAKTPEDLLFQLTKLKLPISQLEYWIIGLPAPSYKLNNIILNEFALIDTMQQNGFSIQYDDYSYAIGKNAFLPGKVIIKTKGLYIKIITQSWLS